MVGRICRRGMFQPGVKEQVSNSISSADKRNEHTRWNSNNNNEGDEMSQDFKAQMMQIENSNQWILTRRQVAVWDNRWGAITTRGWKEIGLCRQTEVSMYTIHCKQEGSQPHRIQHGQHTADSGRHNTPVMTGVPWVSKCLANSRALVDISPPDGTWRILQDT